MRGTVPVHGGYSACTGRILRLTSNGKSILQVEHTQHERELLW